MCEGVRPAGHLVLDTFSLLGKSTNKLKRRGLLWLSLWRLQYGQLSLRQGGMAEAWWGNLLVARQQEAEVQITGRWEERDPGHVYSDQPPPPGLGLQRHISFNLDLIDW